MQNKDVHMVQLLRQYGQHIDKTELCGQYIGNTVQCGRYVGNIIQGRQSAGGTL